MTRSIETRLERVETRLALAALAAVAILLATAALRRIWGVDFWWQWATGRLISESGIPRVDVFSYTAAGEPWIELRWLYCWTLYRLTSALGLPAAVIAKAVVLLAAFGLMAATVLERRGRAVAALALSVAALASSQRFYVRPELVTYLLFALFVWILHRERRPGSTRWIWALPLLQVAWTNSHTVFVLGPCLVGLAFTVAVGRWLRARRQGAEDALAAKRRALRLLVVLTLTAGACLLNPWGLAGVAFPFRLFGEIRGTAFKEGISEFKGPFDFEQSYLALDYYKVLIGLCAAAVAVHLRRLDPFWLLLAASQLYLSILAIRNIPLFALAAIPLVVDGFQRSPWLATGRPRPAARIGNALLAAGVVALCAVQSWRLATDRFHVDQHDTNQFGIGVATSKYAEGAVGFLEEHGLGGRVFHTMAEGAYLVARGYPVYIDPRLEVYGEERFEAYLEAMRSPSVWLEQIEAHEAEILLFDVRSRATRFALGSRGWRLVYFDEVAAVFLRSDAPGPPSAASPVAVNAAVARVRERLPPVPAGREPKPWERVRSPTPYESFARMLSLLGRSDAAAFERDAAALARTAPGS